MESIWIEYQCKSGQTSFLYNKETGEHKWPHALGQGIEGRIMYGHPVGYKEYRTITTQTDDNGCNNGCMSIYINRDQSQHFDTEATSSFEQQASVSNVQMITEIETDCERNEKDNSDDDGDSEVIETNIITAIIVDDSGHVDTRDDDSFDADNNHDTCTNPNQHSSQCIEENAAKQNYECSVCQKVFEESSHLTQHLLVHSEEKNFGSNLTGHSEKPLTGKKCFECTVCTKVFSSKYYLDRHAVVHTREKNFVCVHCEKTFAFKSSLEAHVRLLHTKERLLECSYCKKNFTKKSRLELHMKVHINKKLFECSFCERKFNQEALLTSHVAASHLGKKTFECPICEKEFPFKNQLEIHLRTHTGEKPFECTVCGRRFTCKSLLTGHSKVHSEDRPFECTICENSFYRKSNLDRHWKVHSGEKPYECTVCEERFSRKDYLNKHLKTHSF